MTGEWSPVGRGRDGRRASSATFPPIPLPHRRIARSAVATSAREDAVPLIQRTCQFTSLARIKARSMHEFREEDCSGFDLLHCILSMSPSIFAANTARSLSSGS